MLLKVELLRERIRGVITNKSEQGYNTKGLIEKLELIEDSFDELIKFGIGLSDIRINEDWPYIEPNNLDDIREESKNNRPTKIIKKIDLKLSNDKIKAAFLGSICGCILGKPLETSLTGKEIKEALVKINEWPLSYYVPKKIKDALPRVHDSFHETCRENIEYVAPDDDINYTIMGMLIIEKFGEHFTHKNLSDMWLHHLPINTTFGPERTILLKSGLDSLSRFSRSQFSMKGGVGLKNSEEINYSSELNLINEVLNPGDELCGAAIRADAYGYACPGNPELASKMAWIDSSFTHRRTGIYATMFLSAAISCAQVLEDKMEIIETALEFVPQKSRFFERSLASYLDVKNSINWEDGYAKINNKLGEYGHCRIYQEIGMVINTFKHARDIGHGICIQVSQGADTDSFGASAGSLLGAFYGPKYLDDKWIKPFNDDIHTGLAWFFERSVNSLSKRMVNLPRKIK